MVLHLESDQAPGLRFPPLIIVLLEFLNLGMGRIYLFCERFKNLRLILLYTVVCRRMCFGIDFYLYSECCVQLVGFHWLVFLTLQFPGFYCS